MKTRTAAALAAFTGLAVTAFATAEEVTIEVQGDVITLDSVGMPFLFGTSEGYSFSDDDLGETHDLLHAAGIATEGYVTFLLADTNDGLSFLSLIDDHSIHGDQAAELSVISNAPATANFRLNDAGGDFEEMLNDDDTLTMISEFRWIRGDSLAWSNLADGDVLDFNFTPMGTVDNLTADSPYQFLSPNEAGGWDVVWSGDYDEGEFFFNMSVASVPGPGSVCLLGMASLVGLGRRRRA
jgi:uncharacterized protein (TIGR03382 family)